MKKRGFKGIIFLLMILILLPMLLSGQEKFFSDNYLIPAGHSNFVIDTSSLKEPGIKLIADSLDGLIKTGEIKKYFNSRTG